MKRLLYPLLCAALLAAPACSSKKDDPAAPPQPVTTTVPATFAVTNSGAAVAGASMDVNDYGAVVDNGGTTVHRAIVNVNFPGDQYGPLTARVKYFLTTSQPMGTVTRLESKAYNDSDFNGSATGTLTGRTVVTAGVAHLYLSGTLRANLGPRYPDTSATFTDLKAY